MRYHKPHDNEVNFVALTEPQFSKYQNICTAGIKGTGERISAGIHFRFTLTC
jgi:hypothetical protein